MPQLRAELLQQRLRLFQIKRVKPFREPAINRSKQFARFAYLALVSPETDKAYGGAEFPRLRILLASYCERALEICLCLRDILPGRHQCDIAVYTMDFSLAPSFASCFDCTLCIGNATPSIIELAEFRIGFRQV